MGERKSLLVNVGSCGGKEGLWAKRGVGCAKLEHTLAVLGLLLPPPGVKDLTLTLLVFGQRSLFLCLSQPTLRLPSAPD